MNKPDDMKPLYPYYRYYITRIIFSLLLLPIYVAVAYYVSIATGNNKLFLPTLIACVAIFVISVLIKDFTRKCPRCGKHSLSTVAEPTNITSLSYVTGRVYATCRHCDYYKPTDLAFKSNILLKKIPVKLNN